MALRTDIVSDVAGTGSPVITGGELSRARYNLNGGGTIAARDSFNISSFVDNGTGDYTANFSTAFPAADYSFGLGAQDGSVVALIGGKIAVAPTTTAFRVSTYNGSVVATDVSTLTAIMVGDKP